MPSGFQFDLPRRGIQKKVKSVENFCASSRGGRGNTGSQTSDQFCHGSLSPVNGA